MFSLAVTLWHHTVFLLVSVQAYKKLVPGHIWSRVTLTAELLSARVIIRRGKNLTCEQDKQEGKVIKMFFFSCAKVWVLLLLLYIINIYKCIHNSEMRLIIYAVLFTV